MLKRILVVLALAVSFGFASTASADPSVCLTTDININGTAAPTNGTTCLP